MPKERVTIIFSGRGGELDRCTVEVTASESCTSEVVKWLTEEDVVLAAGDTITITSDGEG